MPNHVYCILFFQCDQYNLNTLVSNGKRFIAYKIIKRLEAKGVKQILLRLKEGFAETGVAKGRRIKYLRRALK